MSTGVGVLVGAGIRSRRRAGLAATFIVLVLAAAALMPAPVRAGEAMQAQSGSDARPSAPSPA